ncbi:MAG: hypothetical protein AAFS10_23505 [Myxococcota bacterium]
MCTTTTTAWTRSSLGRSAYPSGLHTLLMMALGLVMGMTMVACGDFSDTAESTAVSSNSTTTGDGATGAPNSNSTSNQTNPGGTTATSNSTSNSTSNGTTGGTTGTTGPSDQERCLALCAEQTACAEWAMACGDAFAQALVDDCPNVCGQEATRDDVLAREGLACGVLVPALILEPAFADDCDPEQLGIEDMPDPPMPVRTTVGQCEAFAPCGGEPVGMWTIDQLCLDFVETPDENDDDPIPECEGDRTLFAIAGATGTMAIREDGTYEQMLSIAAEIVVEAPQTCLSDAFGISCSDYAVALNSTPDQPPWSCVEEDELCVCRAPFDLEPETSSGVWTRQADTVTLVQEMPVDPDAGPLPLQICAQGDKLDMAVGMPNTDFYYHLDMMRAQ